MGNWDFTLLLYDRMGEFIPILFLALLFYYLLFRKSINSILDPLFLSLIGSAFGFSIVMFLFFIKEISSYYWLNYLLTQLLFLLFLHYTLKSKFEIINPVINIKNESIFIFSFFIITSLTDILCQIYVFQISGFSLFFDSRLETFSGGSGYGLFSRFIDISRTFSLYFVFYYLLSYRKKLYFFLRIYIYIYLCFFIFASTLSGSKSAILLVGYILYCYISANSDHTNFLSVKSYIKPISFIAIVVVIVILYSKTGNMLIAISEFANRFIYYGDIYWQAYPGNSLEIIDKSNPAYALFSDFLGSFRLVSWVELPNPIGIELFQHHHKSDLLMGPNARHNVFGLIYFGYIGSLFFSSLLGIIVGGARKGINAFSKHSHLIKALSIIVFLKVIAFETDPTLVVTGLDSILLVFPFLCILSCIVYFIIIKYVSIHCCSKL